MEDIYANGRRSYCLRPAAVPRSKEQINGQRRVLFERGTHSVPRQTVSLVDGYARTERPDFAYNEPQDF